MDAFFLINHEEVKQLINNPKKNLYKIYRKLCKLPSTRHCLQKSLLIKRNEGTDIPTDIIMENLNNRLKACSTMDNLMDLALSVCYAIGPIPAGIDAFNHWHNWFHETMDNPNFIKEVKDFLYVSYLYNKEKMKSKNKNGDTELLLGRILNHQEEDKKILDDTRKFLNRLSSRQFSNHEDKLFSSDDYIYSLLLNKKFPRYEESKSKPRNKSKTDKDPVITHKSPLKVASVFDAIITLGLSETNRKKNPYIDIMQDYMSRKNMTVTPKDISIKTFLNAFLPDFLMQKSFNLDYRNTLKYILERLTNTNLIPFVYKFSSNRLDTIFKNSMVEVCKFLAMHPLPKYRIQLVRAVEKLVDEEEEAYRNKCLHAIFDSCPNTLVDLLDKNILATIARTIKSDFMKAIKLFFNSILLKSQIELLIKFSNINVSKENATSSTSSMSMLDEAYLKVFHYEKSNLKRVDVARDLRNNSIQNNREMLFYLSEEYFDDMLDVLSVEQLRTIFQYFDIGSIQMILRAEYKDECENKTGCIPIEKLKELFKNMPSCELKDRIKPLTRDNIPISPEHKFPVLDFLSIVTYQSFVFLPVLNLIFHMYVSIKSKESKNFNFEYKIKNYALLNLRNRKTLSDKIRYDSTPNIQLDMYRIYYESLTWIPRNPLKIINDYITYIRGYFKPMTLADLIDKHIVDKEIIPTYYSLSSKCPNSIVNLYFTHLAQLKYRSTMNKCFKKLLQSMKPVVSYYGQPFDLYPGYL